MYVCGRTPPADALSGAPDRCDRREDPSGSAHDDAAHNQSARESARAPNPTPRFIAADVRDIDAIDAMLAQIERETGRLDILVNNAGGAPFALAADASPRFTEAVIRLNLLAPLQLAQRANALMQRQHDGGVLLFIGSVSGLRASPGTAAYGAAKAGLLNAVRSLAVEWAPKVRVCAVSPSLVETEAATRGHTGTSKGDAQTPVLAGITATIPAGRLAQPADIASACLFLASPHAAYASGSNLILEGGGEVPAFLAASGMHQAFSAKSDEPARS